MLSETCKNQQQKMCPLSGYIIAVISQNLEIVNREFSFVGLHFVRYCCAKKSPQDSSKLLYVQL